MLEKNLSFSQVLDIYGFRVVVEDAPACYLALGALHGLYKPMPGKFKDYIAIPKVNGYQSLHTTLYRPVRHAGGNPDPHARHAPGGRSRRRLALAVQDLRCQPQRTAAPDAQLAAERCSTSRARAATAAEFLEHIKVDLFPDEVYVFTPKGKIMALPRGATAVDFAYAVHTDIGNRCVATKINYELVPLRTELKNGDRVEIITAPHANPNPAWLNYVKTGKARSHIRHFLKTMQYEESAELGEKLLEPGAARAEYGTRPRSATSNGKSCCATSPPSRARSCLPTSAWASASRAVVARRLLAASEQPPAEGNAGPIVIRGSEGMAVQFAKCCRPIPGDPIIGSIKKGQGIVIHTHDCPTAAKSRTDPDKWLDVEWAPEPARLFDVGIHVTVMNQRGVLAKVAAAIAADGANINGISMDEDRSPTPICTSRCRSSTASIWRASSAACAGYRRSFASRGRGISLGSGVRRRAESVSPFFGARRLKNPFAELVGFTLRIGPPRQRQPPRPTSTCGPSC